MSLKACGKNILRPIFTRSFFNNEKPILFGKSLSAKNTKERTVRKISNGDIKS